MQEKKLTKIELLLNKTFPKEGDSKLKDTIKKLRAERRLLLKKIAFLEDELINVKKPGRVRKNEPKPLTSKEWRRQFSDKFKQSISGGTDE